MNVLIIRFELAGIDRDAYVTLTEQLAPAVARMPGLLQKAWLADEANGVYGGAYLFADHDSVEAYLGSEMVQGIRNSGMFKHVSIEVFDTLEPATSITLARELALA